MSFGFSVGDIVTLLQLARRTHKGWRDACGHYAEYTSDLAILEAVLGRVEAEARSNGTGFIRSKEDLRGWEAVSTKCTHVLSQLHTVLKKYKSLGQSRSKNWDGIKRNWDRFCIGSHSFEDLHRELAKAVAGLTAYVTVLGVSSQIRMENSELPRIVEKIDNIAAQMRKGNSTIRSSLTAYSDDNIDIWREFRRDLIQSGFRSTDIERYSSALKTYLHRLQHEGALDEEGDDPAEDGDTSSHSKAFVDSQATDKVIVHFISHTSPVQQSRHADIAATKVTLSPRSPLPHTNSLMKSGVESIRSTELQIDPDPFDPLKEDSTRGTSIVPEDDEGDIIRVRSPVNGSVAPRGEQVFSENHTKQTELPGTPEQLASEPNQERLPLALEGSNDLDTAKYSHLLQQQDHGSHKSKQPNGHVTGSHCLTDSDSSIRPDKTTIRHPQEARPLSLGLNARVSDEQLRVRQRCDEQLERIRGHVQRWNRVIMKLGPQDPVPARVLQSFLDLLKDLPLTSPDTSEYQSMSKAEFRTISEDATLSKGFEALEIFKPRKIGSEYVKLAQLYIRHEREMEMISSGLMRVSDRVCPREFFEDQVFSFVGFHIHMCIIELYQKAMPGFWRWETCASVTQLWAFMMYAHTNKPPAVWQEQSIRSDTERNYDVSENFNEATVSHSSPMAMQY